MRILCNYLVGALPYATVCGSGGEAETGQRVSPFRTTPTLWRRNTWQLCGFLRFYKGYVTHHKRLCRFANNAFSSDMLLPVKPVRGARWDIAILVEVHVTMPTSISERLA